MGREGRERRGQEKRREGRKGKGNEGEKGKGRGGEGEEEGRCPPNADSWIRLWMGDCLRAGKLSRYVTSHPGQLSPAIPLWLGTMSTSSGWEGSHRSDVALAMVTDNSGLSTYGLNNLWTGDEHSAYAPSQYGPPLPLPLILRLTKVARWLITLPDNVAEWTGVNLDKTCTDTSQTIYKGHRYQ